jgi:hypothetical protein
MPSLLMLRDLERGRWLGLHSSEVDWSGRWRWDGRGLPSPPSRILCEEVRDQSNGRSVYGSADTLTWRPGTTPDQRPVPPQASKMAGMYYWRVHHTRQNRIDRTAGPDVIQHDDPHHSFPNRFYLPRIVRQRHEPSLL